MNNKDYKICKRCIMDTTDPEIVFDVEGICNHCKRAEHLLASKVFVSKEQKEGELKLLLEQIKKDGQGKKYDCIIGVSGGVDSTYVAYEVKRLGLRPLAVHLDNGWNSELAVSNIEKTLSKLDIELYTYVIDWAEFRDLQMSFLRASTPDGEIPTDHAIISILYRVASQYNVKYILNGVNHSTESIIPLLWGYGYFDFKYIKDVQRKFGTKRLKSFPNITLPKLAYFTLVKKIKFIPFLNYIEYNKKEAMNLIQSKLDWVYYGGKHYESIYTRFFQAYILPRKFKIDKRKGHLSSLIVSHQITRDEALNELKKEICDLEMLSTDREYVIKKFGLTDDEFARIMSAPVKNFRAYANNFELFERLKKLKKILKLSFND